MLIDIGRIFEISSFLLALMLEKHVILIQTQVISTQWTLKRPKKLLKAKFFSKAKFEGQRQKIQIL